MAIEIEPGVMDRLIVRECDSPRTLGREFCERHSLDQSIADYLVKSINENLGLPYNPPTPKENSPVSHQYEKSVFDQISVSEHRQYKGPPKVSTRNPRENGASTVKSPVSSFSHIGPKLYQRGMQLKRKMD
jgi:hypothetical protein